MNKLQQTFSTFILIFCVSILFGVTAWAQTTTFTFQGRLSDNNLAANGTYEMQFSLYDTASGGNQIGQSVSNTNVSIVNGIFTVNLDFGADSFSGAERFLEIGVRAAGSPNPHTLLTPRQAVTSAPYAIKSLNAATADNTNQLGGIDANQYVTGPVVKSVNNLTDNVTLAAGSNITITPVGNTLTIASTGGGGSGGILNQTSQQAGANFNIDGTGAASIFNAATQFNIDGDRILSNQGTLNLFVGRVAGNSNTGFANTFLGAVAGQSNTTGDENTFVGAAAGRNNTTGFGNSIFGKNAGVTNTTGSRNSFFGRDAGGSNTTGESNSIFGYIAGQSSTGSFNSFFGAASGRQSTTGTNNSFFGYEAGILNTTGGFNSFFGGTAGRSTTTGGFNAFFGNDAGISNTSGSRNTMVGRSADVGAGNLSNATAIGYRAFVTQSDSLVLGGILGVNGATTDTNVGIGTTAPNARLHITANSGNILFGETGCTPGHAGIGFGSDMSGCSNYSLLGNGTHTYINRPTDGSIIFRENNSTQMTINPGGTVAINTLGSAGSTQLCRNGSLQISTCSSSLRYKTNIASLSLGLDLVNRLRPITFDWKDGGMHDLGLGAEDVAAIEPLLVHYNEKGEVEGVKYDRIGVVLLNAVKGQQSQIETQQRQLQQQQLMIDGLKKLVCRTSAQAEECREEK